MINYNGFPYLNRISFCIILYLSWCQKYWCKVFTEKYMHKRPRRRNIELILQPEYPETQMSPSLVLVRLLDNIQGKFQWQAYYSWQSQFIKFITAHAISGCEWNAKLYNFNYSNSTVLLHTWLNISLFWPVCNGRHTWGTTSEKCREELFSCLTRHENLAIHRSWEYKT